jgi:phage terminase small subunit
MRGRKPKHTALKTFAGNPSKKTLNRNEPEPAVETPDCPVCLDDDAQAEWSRTTREIHAVGLFSRIDRASLIAHRQACSHSVKAAEMLRSTGPVVKSETNGRHLPQSLSRRGEPNHDAVAGLPHGGRHDAIVAERRLV